MIARSARGKRGFTLIELLVVLAVIGILSVLAVPAMQSITQSYGITNALSQIRDTLSGAQQLAVSDNLPVQVRICKPNSGTIYTWLQVCEVQNDGSVKLGLRSSALPNTACISTNPLFSSIMNLTVNTPAATDPALSTIGQQYTYLKITFLPSGATDLSSSANWFMTIVSPAKSAATTLPGNYGSIQIDPVNGITTVFRP